MPTPNDYQIIRRARGNWVLRRIQSRRPTRANIDMQTALDLAAALCKKSGGKLYIHNDDGTVQRVLG